MSRRSVFPLLLLFSAPVLADPAACRMCHDADEFAGVDPETVQEALADPGIPPHGRFAELTIDEIEALLEALAE